jgi:ribosomal protein S6--L-glutamate ligase
MTKKILILSTSPDCYSTQRLLEEIQKKAKANKDLDIEGEVELGTNLYASISSAKGHDAISRRGETRSEKLKSKDYIAIIPRVAGTDFEYNAMIIEHFTRNLGIFSTASSFGMKVCSNKFYNAQFLSKYRLRVPKQILAHQPTDYSELINMLGGLPVIAKLQRGSMGEGVMILNDILAASTALRSFEKLGSDVVLQKFINSGEVANDIRIVVVGAETASPKLFSYKRYAVASDFRSNYSISGLGEKVEITDEEKEMAIEASKLMGMGVCGIDIMRAAKDDNKPYIIETNGSAGLKGVETITGENVAGAIIDYVLENYKKGNVFNKSYTDDTEITVMHYLARVALEKVEESNLHGTRQDLYKKNYAAQDYLNTLIRKLKHVMQFNEN